MEIEINCCTNVGIQAFNIDDVFFFKYDKITMYTRF